MKGAKLQEVVLRYLNGEQVMDELIENIEPMIVSIIMKYKCKCEYEDLYQTAWVTIMKCLQNYKVESSILFSTYCYRAISNDLIQAENKERKHLSRFNKDGECTLSIVSKDYEYEGKYGSKSSLESVIPNDDWEISKQVIFKELTPEVVKIAENLTPSAKRIVHDYLKNKRQCDIARELGVSYAYVSMVIRNFINECQNEFKK